MKKNQLIFEQLINYLKEKLENTGYFNRRGGPRGCFYSINKTR